MLRLLKNKNLIILTRLFLGFILFGAGMSKLYFEHAFPGIIGPVWLEERLAEHGLAFFARFVALSQILAGLLLLTQRFATLGAIISFPLILNILMVTISLKWQGTPYINAIFLLMNSYLLLVDYHKLKFIISDADKSSYSFKPVRKEPSKDLVFLLAIALIFISIKVSFLSLYTAWGLVIVSLVTIAYLQLKKKHSKK
jgi:uncharacterized membrane protein YphA (DoxX/SURF4 family)